MCNGRETDAEPLESPGSLIIRQVTVSHCHAMSCHGVSAPGTRIPTVLHQARMRTYSSQFYQGRALLFAVWNASKESMRGMNHNALHLLLFALTLLHVHDHGATPSHRIGPDTRRMQARSQRPCLETIGAEAAHCARSCSCPSPLSTAYRMLARRRLHRIASHHITSHRPLRFHRRAAPPGGPMSQVPY